MQAQRGSYIALAILNLGTLWGWWSKPRLGRFTTWVRFPVSIVEKTEWAPRSVWIGMGNRNSLENSSLLGYYPACSGNSLPMFRDNISRILDPEELDPLGCPETSVWNYHYTPRNSPKEHGSRLLCGGSLRSCRKTLVPTGPQAPNRAALASVYGNYAIQAAL